MKSIDWQEEVTKRKGELIADAQQLLRIKSVLDEETKSDHAPFGKGIQEALEYLLTKADHDQFSVKNVDGYAGHIEWGKGEEIVGVLCHIDVVPEGDGWTSPPYAAEIRDGEIVARGALDDKGPTMAAYYALKLIKELDLPLSKRVRMIIGTDEESDWRCVDHYFKHEEMPAVGFAPDADFPIIFAEKGICDFELIQAKANVNSEGKVKLEHFESGRRLNMVPDLAEASISLGDNNGEELIEAFSRFIEGHELEGSSRTEDGRVYLQVKGVSAHGMEPKNGRNAGLYLAQFLAGFSFDEQAATFLTFVKQYFVDDSRGTALGIACYDEEVGDLTINIGRLTYEKETGGKLGVNLRYPAAVNFSDMMTTLTTQIQPHAFQVENVDNSEPHHVEKEDPLVTTLQGVYERQTGEKAELIAIGGGTYARALKRGVAFGPLFPGRADAAHQKDESIAIEDLLQATALYAEAIYELAK
ncbi:dipeptidase PepV [Desertibacillus haloalkaliphilus]|uniref:dipeptidase PepV n=1 Tax=Desertibacillus haloalkaliphilus TaxID=1328930 RepID=UPI001C25C86D|nr:dipeptidase PepV [Desertibacillus haloalkaliphilus]MBU8905262.1 dipeptidase PepV [Desertibacillus haloalkaliphilus]